MADKTIRVTLKYQVYVWRCWKPRHIQCESNPLRGLVAFFYQNGWEFFNQILHAYYAFLSTLDCEFLFNYLQLWRSYAILSVTTHFTSCVQNVHHRPKRTLTFSDIIPKQLGIFRPNFTRLLKFMCTLEYKFLFNYLQLWRSYAILSATTQRAFWSMVHILSTLWWSRLLWHNFVKVAGNWIKVCIPA